MPTRRASLRRAAGLAGGLLIAGCTGRRGRGTLAVRLAGRGDAVSDFESCVLTVTGLWVTPPDGRPVDLSFDPVAVDLVRLRGAQSTLVGRHAVETGEYVTLGLQVRGARGRLGGGERVEVAVPGGAATEFAVPFSVEPGRQTTVTVGLEPVRAGSSYVIRPVDGPPTVAGPRRPTDGR